jgi:hypothetical protein
MARSRAPRKKDETKVMRFTLQRSRSAPFADWTKPSPASLLERFGGRAGIGGNPLPRRLDPNKAANGERLIKSILFNRHGKLTRFA